MADINESELRQSDSGQDNSGQTSSPDVSPRQDTVDSAQHQSRPSPSPEEVALQEARNSAIRSHIRRLSSSKSTAAFAANSKYLEAVARQISEGDAPFRPQSHHFWSYRIKPGTRL